MIQTVDIVLKGTTLMKITFSHPLVVLDSLGTHTHTHSYRTKNMQNTFFLIHTHTHIIEHERGTESEPVIDFHVKREEIQALKKVRINLSMPLSLRAA
jgi:hypothetical protein